MYCLISINFVVFPIFIGVLANEIEFSSVDLFGKPSNLFLPGTVTHLFCPAKNCMDNEIVTLTHATASTFIKESLCDVDSEWAVFELEHDSPLGVYSCTYKTIVTGYFTYSRRSCSQNPPLCYSKCIPGSYCFEETSRVWDCLLYSPHYCETATERNRAYDYAPPGSGKQWFCSRPVVNGNQAVVTVGRESNVTGHGVRASRGKLPFVQGQSAEILGFMEPLKYVRGGGPFRITCPVGIVNDPQNAYLNLPFNCNITFLNLIKTNASETYKKFTGTCPLLLIQLPKNEKEYLGSQLMRLSCIIETITTAGHIDIIENNIVYFDNELIIENVNNALECKLRNDYDKTVFTTELTWKDKNGVVMKSVPNSDGVYRCDLTINYHSCSPYRDFSTTNNMIVNFNGGTLEPTTTTPPTSVSTKEVSTTGKTTIESNEITDEETGVEITPPPEPTPSTGGASSASLLISGSLIFACLVSVIGANYPF